MKVETSAAAMEGMEVMVVAAFQEADVEEHVVEAELEVGWAA